MTALLRAAAFDDLSFLSPENTQKFLSQSPGGPAIIGITWRRSPPLTRHVQRESRSVTPAIIPKGTRDIRSVCELCHSGDTHARSPSVGSPSATKRLIELGGFGSLLFFVSFQSHA